MEVKFEKGSLTVDLHSMLELVSAEDKIMMIESLSCDDDIIKHVADQIMGRWTENGYSGGSCCTPSPNPPEWDALDRAWRNVAKASGEVAKREIERLEDALKSANERNQRLLDENYDLRHGTGSRYA